MLSHLTMNAKVNIINISGIFTTISAIITIFFSHMKMKIIEMLILLFSYQVCPIKPYRWTLYDNAPLRKYFWILICMCYMQRKLLKKEGCKFYRITKIDNIYKHVDIIMCYRDRL
jgi:hypothetical protein